VDELNVCPEPGAVVHLDGPQDSHHLKEITIANSHEDFPAGIAKSQGKIFFGQQLSKLDQRITNFIECKEKSRVCFGYFQIQNTVFDTLHGFLFGYVVMNFKCRSLYTEQM
jgi:hypothetical protein